MEGGRAKFAQRRHMRRRSIALVRGPAIAGIVGIGGDHDPVAMLLCDNARRRDAGVERITTDHGLGGPAPARQAIAINKNMGRVKAFGAQRLNRAGHGKEGRL